MRRRTRYFFRKWRAQAAPLRLAPLDEVAWSLVGGALGIALLVWLGRATGNPFLIAPFGATCVLLFAAPDSPLAQPRAVVGGHCIATAIALAVLTTVGGGWDVAPLAVGLAIGAMVLTRTVHPPAGADPVLILLLPPSGWSFLVAPILVGSLALVLLALVFNNLARGRRYPRFW